MEKKRFILNENTFYQNSFDIDLSNYNIGYWNVDETISELSYLTHSYFRYYGKFPSKIGKNIIKDLAEGNRITKENDFIFDNYLGSGTTLVESKLHDFDSVGIDISPFAVLASRVKTYTLDIEQLVNTWSEITHQIIILLNKLDTVDTIIDNKEDDKLLALFRNNYKNIFIEFKDVSKWFDEKNIRDLVIIKTVLLNIKPSRIREFFALGFFAIIRRVSRAYDGEVRPHVNKKKKVRNVYDAYAKKINEMIEIMKEWQVVANRDIYCDAFVCDNKNKDKIKEIIQQTKSITGKKLGAVVSHPPYLNCFDYIPVYKLKFLWAFGFDEIYKDYTLSEIKKMENKCYPASSHKNIDRYFNMNMQAYKIIYEELREGGYCCIVIGDCTVQKQLFRVHKTFISMLEEIGFTIEKIVYRSTNYGLGKYAYDFRADYHEDEESKKDAVIFAKK